MKRTYITMHDIDRYEKYLIEQEKSSNTVEKYMRDVKRFALFAGLEHEDDKAYVTKQMVISYKQKLQETYTSSSANSMLTAVNVFLKHHGLEKCCVRLLKVQRRVFRDEEKELSKSEYIKLVETARKKNDVRLVLVMKSICATGIRISELKFITVENVRRGFAEITCKGKCRKVILPNKLCRELRKYAAERKITEGAIFCTRGGQPMDRSNIWKAMKQLCEEAGVMRTKVFPHNLRHLFAVVFYKNEKDIIGLADILGHSSIDTTRIYTMVSREAYVGKVNKLGLVV